MSVAGPMSRILLTALLVLAPLTWSMQNENSALAKSFAAGVFAAALALAAVARISGGGRRFAPMHALMALAAISGIATRSPSFGLMSLLPAATLWMLALSAARIPAGRWTFMVLLGTVLPILTGSLQALGADPGPWQSVVRTGFHGRICSTLGNPNFYSAFIVAVLPFGLSASLTGGSVFMRAATGVITCLAFLNLLHAGSKGGILGAAGMAAVWGAAAWKSGLLMTIPPRRLRLAAVAAAVILAAGLASLPGVVKTRLAFNAAGEAEDAAPSGGAGIARNESVRFRLLTWKQGLFMIRDAPLAGLGLGRFQVMYPAYRPPEIIRMFGQHSYMTDHPENLPLEAAVELGFPGLGLALWLLVATARALAARLAAGPGPERWFAASSLAALAGLLLTNSTGVDIHYGATAVLAACLTGAALGAVPAQIREAGNAAGSGISMRAGAVAAALLLAMAWARVFGSDSALARALSFSQAGAWDPAIAAYREAGMLNPFNVIARYFGASALLDRGRAEDIAPARELFESVRREAPDFVLINYKLYLLYSKIGDIREAEAALARQVRLDPVAAVFHLDRGRAALNAGNRKEAMEAFRAAIEAEPANPAGYQYLGNLHVLEGRYREALSVYEAGLARKPDAVELLYNAAVAAYKMGDRASALRYAGEVLRISPGHAQALVITRKLQ